MLRASVSQKPFRKGSLFWEWLWLKILLLSGWWFGTLGLFFHISGMSSSQLTNSYFSEGLKPPQPPTSYPESFTLAITSTHQTRRYEVAVQPAFGGKSCAHPLEDPGAHPNSLMVYRTRKNWMVQGYPGYPHFRKPSDPIAEGLENGDIMEDSGRSMG